MNVRTETVSAVNAPNSFVEAGGRRLAYRTIGEGKPIVLCVRFRGTMDVWDPAFLDALAAHGFQVVTFDYSGLGHSTGERSMNPFDLAKDASDLIAALALRDVVISGWSLGGLAAQAALAVFPQNISHAVLIGCIPPGPQVKLGEQLFYDTAVIPDYTLEHETILFFEPKNPASVAAAARSVARIAARSEGRSPPVPVDWAAANLGTEPKANPFPADIVLEALRTTTLPILHVGADHDIPFPVENWYAHSGEFPTVQLITWPNAGHGPQHEFPEAVAEQIATFVRATTGKAQA